jgi:hypothetical protein
MDDQISVGQSNEPFIDEITRDQVGKALGLKDFAEVKKNQDQIKRLIDWAQAKGAKDTTDVVWSVKQLANRVGAPHIGNNWAQHLAQYAYLEMERMNIDKQLSELGPKMENPKIEKGEKDE